MKQRIKSCAKLLKEQGFDCLIVSKPTNITYLTGCKQPDGYLLITSDQELIYFTNFIYMKVSQQIKIWKLIVCDNKSNIFKLVADQLKQLKCRKVAFESKHLPFLEYKTLHQRLQACRILLLGAKDIVERLRMIKDQKELSLIKKSVQITKEAFEFISEIFEEKMSEKDLTIEAEKFLRLKGDDRLAFKPIVASGKNTVFPHHLPNNTIIGKKFFLIDLGSSYYGYCADLTRVFFWGKMPLLFKKIYSTVIKAQELAIKGIKDGAKANQIDKLAREVIEKKGYGKYFGHGLGHGIGISVHEPPFLVPGNTEVLKEGMVVTVEPAIYFKDELGIRVEEMVLVKKNKGEVLSGNSHR